MNNILSYCGLVDARISASEKDLPVFIRTDKNPAAVCIMRMHQPDRTFVRWGHCMSVDKYWLRGIILWHNYATTL